ncbi:hypothetical protein GCM10009557_07330 [Virgisporangium ochraceum]|uniref:Uncharacterized protein n=1 Tax=Virgisporangium ochraceum TaxID=65505 RepID=A0A8J4A619_9ACTN|nr:hypothetical protein [Virgisporangium ochraceum]GIJ74520.1 hypothetical protein Voc01_094370 [Virgisporangium ochraceum]
MSAEPHDSPGAPGATRLLGVIGWIFADMLLVLVVVFLATQTGGAVTIPPAAVASGSPTPTPSSPSPEATPGVDSDFVCLRVDTDPALLTGGPSAARDAHLADIERQVRERVSQPDLAGRRAGIVLSFGIADLPDDGTKRAAAFNREILPRLPAVFRRADGGPVANRPFWGGRPRGDRRSGAIEVNIYPIIDATHGPLARPGAETC